jgi:hypothetical protein
MNGGMFRRVRWGSDNKGSPPDCSGSRGRCNHPRDSQQTRQERAAPFQILKTSKIRVEFPDDTPFMPPSGSCFPAGSHTNFFKPHILCCVVPGKNTGQADVIAQLVEIMFRNPVSP